MRSSSSPGFDLREALDSLRETFGPLTTARTSADADADAGERRDIRAAILRELVDEPMHGYQVIRAVETRSGGTWKPSPGSVYPTLQLLDDEGLVVAAQVGERKVYSLTEAGRQAAAMTADAEPPSGRGEPRRGRGVHSRIALTRSGVTLVQALTQVAQSGSPEQSERATAIVDEARRKLYAILAEG
jgi:DNA-binding PadR family transcriptional regulator